MTMTMDFLLSENRLKELTGAIQLNLERGKQIHSNPGTHHYETAMQTTQRTRRDLDYCVDRLSEAVIPQSIPVTVCCLKSLARQSRLEFSQSDDRSCFLSCPTFFIEITLSPDKGEVMTLNIQHGPSEKESCPSLYSALRKWDIPESRRLLLSLVNLYNVKIENLGDENSTYDILQALSADLSNISNQYRFSNEESIMKSPVGVLNFQEGGFPTTVTFFALPTIIPNRIPSDTMLHCAEIILQSVKYNNLGINVENCGDQDREVSKFCQLNHINICASYWLKINRKVALSMCAVRDIESLCCSFDTCSFDEENRSQVSLLNCISSDDNNKITANQVHQYTLYMNEEVQYYFISIDQYNFDAMLVNSISFTNADSLLRAIQIVRHQLTFNSLVSSIINFCTPTDTMQHKEHVTLIASEGAKHTERIFDITFYPIESIQIQFQHPEDNNVTVTLKIIIDINQPTQLNVYAKMATFNWQGDFEYSHILSVLLRKCPYIPPFLKRVLSSFRNLIESGNIQKSVTQYQPESSDNFTTSYNPHGPYTDYQSTFVTHNINPMRAGTHSLSGAHIEQATGSQSKSGHKRKYNESTLLDMQHKKLK